MTEYRVRAAQVQDIPAIIEIARGMHDESSYAPLRFDGRWLAANLQHMLDNGQGLFCATLEDVVVGGIICYTDRTIFSLDLVAFEHVLYLAPEHRRGRLALRLVKKFIDWAKAKGCVQIRPGVTTGDVGKNAVLLYKAAGFQQVGETFVMDIAVEIEHA